MTSRCIGPELPPGMKRPSSSEDGESAHDEEGEEPAAPAIGPVLPAHLKKSANSVCFSPHHGRLSSSGETQPSTSTETRRGSEAIGPALPPHLQHLAAKNDKGSGSASSDSSDEDGQIGPSVGLQGGDYDMKKEFSDREQRIQASKEVVLERESWMTELPSDRTGVKINPGARMFTKREGTDSVLDDSWTAIPGQEKQKPRSDKKAEQNQLDITRRKRDAEIDERLAEYNAAKRSKPLIEMHKEERDRKSKKKNKKGKKMKKKDKRQKKDKEQKKDKKKKSKKKKDDDDSDDSTPPTRKPFNWEEDMRVSMVDTTRAQSMLDKTLLQSRFASSKSQKYL